MNGYARAWTGWLEVQQKAKDTVVQIFSQLNQFDWFEPYKTPEQVGVFASGFFISDDGYLVTNFHVVDEASSVQIQIPYFGKEQFDAEVVGVYPEMDTALLKLSANGVASVRAKLGAIPYLPLGDSDAVVRTQEILAIGYPLGQQSLKTTQGIISGREKINFRTYMQITAPLNPGSSGGPSLNEQGSVIGVNFAGVLSAQNVGYIIPINEIKSALKDLHRVKLLRRPYLGGVFSVASDDVAAFLGNPAGSGFYIAEIFPHSSLEKAGIKEGDMIYQMNGFDIDQFGEVAVPWSEDKISMFDLMNRYEVGDKLDFLLYRKGKKMHIQLTLERASLLPIRYVYPRYEPVDYEIIGGMVIMELTLNHVSALCQQNPFYFKYHKVEYQDKSQLIITHILPNSPAHRTRCLDNGYIIVEVNGEPVCTLSDFRRAVLTCKQNGYLTLKAENKVFAVISLSTILADEEVLSKQYFYPISALVKKLKGK